MRWCGSCRGAVLADGIDGVQGGMIEMGGGAIGPGDAKGVDAGQLAQADDLFIIDRGLEATAGDEFAVEDLSCLVDTDLAADGEGIGRGGVKEDADIMIF